MALFSVLDLNSLLGIFPVLDLNSLFCFATRWVGIFSVLGLSAAASFILLARAPFAKGGFFFGINLV